MIYELEIFGEKKQVTIDELRTLLDTFTIDQLSDIYFEFPAEVKAGLRDYFHKRMSQHLGM